MAQPHDPDLPGLDDIRDTLMFVWGHFFDRMIDAWLAAPGQPLETEWGGAAVTMRHRLVPAAHGAPISDFVELAIAAHDGSFAARATFLAARPETATAGIPPASPVEWSTEGDYEEFIAWMVPWVSKHVAEGGGWIDFS